MEERSTVPTANGNFPPNRVSKIVTTPFIATAFATAFTIIDPVGMIPLTITVTAASTGRERSAIVDRAILVATGVIFVMAIVGKVVLNSLGITLPAFTIAGGILLFLISIDMLFARKTGAKQTDEEEREGAESGNPAVFPLAVPMIAGPGTIATVLVLVSIAHGDRYELAIVFAAYASAIAVTWLCMRLSAQMLRLIGTTGIHVVTRLFGILLSALAIQFVINGLAETPLFAR
jgi:multiple antibiotic resistance protein